MGRRVFLSYAIWVAVGLNGCAEFGPISGHRDRGGTEPPAGDVDSVDCMDGDVQHVGGDGTCYFAFNAGITWREADQACRNRNAHLVAIDSYDENMEMVLLAKEVGAGWNRFWLGGNDIGEEGAWRWSGLEQPLMYRNWKVGSPGTEYASSEDCMALDLGDFNHGWVARLCELLYPFVCERGP